MATVRSHERGGAESRMAGMAGLTQPLRNIAAIYKCQWFIGVHARANESGTGSNTSSIVGLLTDWTGLDNDKEKSCLFRRGKGDFSVFKRQPRYPFAVEG